jgi:hypothetical protein
MEQKVSESTHENEQKAVQKQRGAHGLCFSSAVEDTRRWSRR